MNEFFVFLDFLNIYIDTNYNFSILIFFVFLLVYKTFSIPGNLIFVVSAGYFFGIYIGYIISIVSIVLGSLIFFTFSKLFLKKLFTNIYDKYSTKINKYISNSSIEYLILFRMMPGPPLMMQNVCLSITVKRFVHIAFIFILTSFIGFSPIIFVAVYFGSKIKSFESIKNITMNSILSRDFLIFVGLMIFFLSLRIIFKKKS